MEETDYITQQWGNNVKLGQRASAFLLTLSKWGKFIAIVNYIIFGFLLVFMISTLFAWSWASVIIEQFGTYLYIPTGISSIYILVWLIVLACYFLPAYFLYSSSVRIQNALSNKNSRMLTTAVKNMKNYFIAIGSITIIQAALFIGSLIMIF